MWCVVPWGAGALLGKKWNKKFSRLKSSGKFFIRQASRRFCREVLLYRWFPEKFGREFCIYGFFPNGRSLLFCFWGVGRWTESAGGWIWSKNMLRHINYCSISFAKGSGLRKFNSFCIKTLDGILRWGGSVHLHGPTPLKSLHGSTKITCWL